MRQLASVVPFSIGLLMVVRLAPDWASVTERWLGIPYGAALMLVGLVLFAAVTVVGWVALRALAGLARFPGLNTLDRLVGAFMGLVWMVVGLIALTWFASFLSLPETLEAMLSDSGAVVRVAGPDSLPRRLLDSLTRHGWEAMLERVHEVTGSVDNLLADLVREGTPQP